MLHSLEIILINRNNVIAKSEHDIIARTPMMPCPSLLISKHRLQPQDQTIHILRIDRNFNLCNKIDDLREDVFRDQFDLLAIEINQDIRDNTMVRLVFRNQMS